MAVVHRQHSRDYEPIHWRFLNHQGLLKLTSGLIGKLLLKMAGYVHELSTVLKSARAFRSIFAPIRAYLDTAGQRGKHHQVAIVLPFQVQIFPAYPLWLIWQNRQFFRPYRQMLVWQLPPNIELVEPKFWPKFCDSDQVVVAKDQFAYLRDKQYLAGSGSLFDSMSRAGFLGVSIYQIFPLEVERLVSMKNPYLSQCWKGRMQDTAWDNNSISASVRLLDKRFSDKCNNRSKTLAASSWYLRKPSPRKCSISRPVICNSAPKSRFESSFVAPVSVN